MTAGTITPYRPGQQAGRDGFAQLLRAEWTKFRTVRGWVIGMTRRRPGDGGARAVRRRGHQQLVPEHERFEPRAGPAGSACVTIPPVGPGGEPVSDSFYFVRQPLAGNGSITVRMTSLTGLLRRTPTSRPARTRRSTHVPAWCHGPRPGSSSRTSTQPGIGVRGDDGHRRPRGTHAGQLHQRHGGPAGRRLPGVPALAAADPLRRHDHRLRLGRRHALDSGRHRPPGRAAVDRPGRAVRRLPCVHRGLPELRRRGKRDHRLPARPPPSSITSAGRAPGRAARGPATTSEPATGRASAGITRPAAGSP